MQATSPESGNVAASLRQHQEGNPPSADHTIILLVQKTKDAIQGSLNFKTYEDRSEFYKIAYELAEIAIATPNNNDRQICFEIKPEYDMTALVEKLNKICTGTIFVIPQSSTGTTSA